MLNPLGLDVEWERRPWGVLGLVSVMTAVLFAAMRADRESIEPFLLQPGDVRPWQLVTATFLHAGPWHLLWNVLYLWVFGRYVEEALGSLRMVVLLLLFGVAGHLVFLWKGSGVPLLGASGAVAGLMGLVLFAAPKVPVRVMFGWRHRRDWRVPAWIFLGLWLAVQLVAVRGEAEDGVAYTAHLGGFLAGCLAAWLLRSPLVRGTGWYLPRAIDGGDAHGRAYGEMLADEGAWRAIDEHLQTKAKREADEPKAFDITPPGGSRPAPPPRTRP